ncbi:MAG: TetR family transcriptional regulator [Micrococcales bacterium 70-64]|nr:MAG: TetR family transcriptional regulator [Leifsonia sp. SCN 70-46]OJX87259.1 MAG: TetR family transcriptional regulator [Micrococcales bacterium 70-64]
MLDAAAHLFAERGFARVSLEDLGAAVGVSGPAVYRHFAGKQAVLGALLVEVSEGLASGGRSVVDAAGSDEDALAALIAFHVDFALANSDVIRVQDRDLDSLTDTDRHDVRALQRAYVELWVDVLSRLTPSAERAVLRTRAHATFGLINSTPHSGSTRGSSQAQTRAILERMAAAALRA